ncbi:hypothetical protein FRC07_004782 [Ceratobasidium sp. 392]|nr:hypothetical protein FRC07_004782 [Ceratobasidium sp. 392]
MAEANLTFYIGDKPIPVHPLDLTSVGTFNNGTNMTVCLSDFEPYTGAAGGGVLDMILGDAFLRNAYTVFNFGSLVDGIFGSPSGNPYVKILPLTEPKSASADFKKARTAQLAKLPPQVDVTTYNDAHPKAAQEQVKAAKHTSISGNVCAAIAVGAAILVLVVIGWLVMKNRNHKMNWFQAKVNAIRGSNERYNPV